MSKINPVHLPGGPVSTPDEFLEEFAKTRLSPGEAAVVYSTLGWSFTRDPRVVEAILSHAGTTLKDCIEILAEAFPRMHNNWEQSQVAELTDNTREAARLLGACPREAAAWYGSEFAKAAIGMNAEQLEVFARLVSDRNGETPPDDPYTRVDIVGESAKLTRVLVT